MPLKYYTACKLFHLNILSIYIIQNENCSSHSKYVLYKQLSVIRRKELILTPYTVTVVVLIQAYDQVLYTGK